MLVAIELLILLRDFERRARGIDRGDALAHPRQVQRESSLIGEDVERLAVRISRGSSVVLPLIEKRACLLPAERVVVEANVVEREDSLRLITSHQLRFAWRQLLQLADVRIDALDQTRGREVLGQRLHHQPPEIVAIEGLRLRLQGNHIVVLVDDEARQQISFAEDYPVRIAVGALALAGFETRECAGAADLLAKSNRDGDACAHEIRQRLFGNLLGAEQANRNL